MDSRVYTGPTEIQLFAMHCRFSWFPKSTRFLTSSLFALWEGKIPEHKVAPHVVVVVPKEEKEE